MKPTLAHQSDAQRKASSSPGAEFPTAAAFLPARLSLRSLREAAKDCRGCPLYRQATHTVFGEGPAKAELMLIGETPGDQEDLAARPFIGPAGALLSDALEQAGLHRSNTYVTNAVKHFKWEPRGKRRLHAKPSARETAACRPWLEAELKLVRPRVVVCLGATAAQALLGRTFRITHHRGELHQCEFCEHIVPTYHPAAVLRAPSHEDRARMREQLVIDLKLAAKTLRSE